MKPGTPISVRNIGAVAILFGLVLLCMVWAGLYVKIQSERKMEMDSSIRDTVRYARAFAEHTARTVRGLDGVTLYLKHEAEEKGLNLDLPGLMREGRFEGQPFQTAGVMDETGRLVASTQIPLPLVDNSDLDFFRLQRDNPGLGLLIGRPLVGRASGKLLIQMSRRIDKPDGSFGGVVVIGVDPNYFAEFYQQVDLGEGSSIVLMGRDGFIRLRQSGQTVNIGLDFRQAEIMQQLAVRDEGTFISSSPADGVKRLRSFRALKEYPLVVWVGVTEDFVYADLTHRLSGYYWICTAISLVIVLFVGILLWGIARQQQDSKRREQAEAKLRDSEARLLAIANSTREGIIMINPAGLISYWNPAAAAIFGYSAAAALGRELHQLLMPSRYHAAQRQGFAEFRRSGGGAVIGKTVELQAMHRDGYEFSIELSLSTVRFEDGWHAAGIVRDITARKQAEAALQANQEELSRTNELLLQSQAALEHQASHDPLTGLLNRRAAMDLFAKELARCQRSGNTLAVGLCDIDHFKVINDGWGHQIGDEVLCWFTGIAAQSFRSYDILARIGGEEFLLIVPLGDDGDADAVFERFRQLVAATKMQTRDGRLLEITVSIGVAYAKAGSEIVQLIAEADAAMYLAKAQGRNRVVFSGKKP